MAKVLEQTSGRVYGDLDGMACTVIVLAIAFSPECFFMCRSHPHQQCQHLRGMQQQQQQAINAAATTTTATSNDEQMSRLRIRTD